MTVHPLGPDGAIGEEIKQAARLDGGIFAHQIRMMPSNKALVLVTRGNNATATKAEDPGALKVKALKNGQLTDIASIAPGAGYGFGPRHVDASHQAVDVRIGGTAEPASDVPHPR